KFMVEDFMNQCQV
uniref:Uncharacterized protein n=1 Tax=Panagrolaimus sp. JU765 TaxID=591449 RepID=A0AC34R6Z2_9BILA